MLVFSEGHGRDPQNVLSSMRETGTRRFSVLFEVRLRDREVAFASGCPPAIQAFAYGPVDTAGGAGARRQLRHLSESHHA